MTEKPAGFKKQSRNEKVESATLEPELKVSSEGFRRASSELPIGTYPQYVDVTSIGRRRNSTTTGIEKETSTSASHLEDPLHYVEFNSTTRRQNMDYNSDFTHTVPSSISPQASTEPGVVDSQPHYVHATSPARSRGTTSPTTEISKDTVTTKEQTVIDASTPKYTDVPRRRSTTVPSISDVPTTEKQQTHKPKHENIIFRRRSTTVRSIDVLANKTEHLKTDDSVVQTIPPSAVTTTITQSTPEGPSIKDTIPTPTTTRFTPTVTRIVTSVTESGTTERQIIAVNRVPYIAIAALRGEKFYPGPVGHNRHQPATATKQPFLFRSSLNSFLEQTTIPVRAAGEQSLEKVMEVNRITLVTSKEEMPLAYTRTISGNETTERTLVQTQSEKTTDRVSEVSRLKHVTAVAGVSQTATPSDYYVTDTLREELTTIPTIIDIPTDRIYHENAIDSHRENPPSKLDYHPTTSVLQVDSVSINSETVMEPIVTQVTEKHGESVPTSDEISSTDIPPRSVTLNNRRRQGSGRKPGVDDFKTRRTRPTFSTTSAETQISSTPSTFAQKRRGQRKRPRPYQPTLTNATNAVPNHSTVANSTANADPNKEPRRTFIPSRGQRKKPRPYLQTSTPATADDVINSVEKDRSENKVLSNERNTTATSGFIPKRGYRRRGKTQVGITEIPNTTSTKATQKDTLSNTENESANVAKSFAVVPTEGNTDVSSVNSKPSTQGSDIFSSEARSNFVPRKNYVNINVTTEQNTNSRNDSDESDVNDIQNSQSTGSDIFTTDISPESQFELDITELIPYLNNTGKDTDQSVPEETEVLKPTSVFSHKEAVTTTTPIKYSSPASSIRERGHSDRVRIMKRRKRPTTNSSVTPPTEAKDSRTESSSESKITSRKELNTTDNEIKTSDLISERNLSASTLEENPVTPFATAALFERYDYKVGTPASVSEFATTVDTQGKNLLEIFVLNDQSDEDSPQKSQKSKSVSTKDIGKVKNATARNISNNLEIFSQISELTTSKDRDLNTDGSGYATGSTGIKAIYPLSKSEDTSERFRGSSLTTTVEFLNEGRGEKISHDNFAKVSIKHQSTDNYIASVDFIADSRDDKTLGSTAVRGRNKPLSENTEGKKWRLVRRRRPGSTTAEPQTQSEVGRIQPRAMQN